MDKYCVVEKRALGHHAASKARNDIADICAEDGWRPVWVHSWKKNSVWDKLKMLLVTASDWRRVSEHVPDGAELLIQYPLATFPKTRKLALPFLRNLKNRGVRLVFLIHDLDSLRGTGREMEKAFLDMADALIVHNSKMDAYLQEIGYGKQKRISLGLFDYLLPEWQAANFQSRSGGKTILIAGNLDPEKSGYVYQLKQLQGDLRFSLYGPNYKEEDQPEQVSYQGSFPPEVLPDKLDGDFGLVWDGDSLDSCSGVYGAYLRYNNPHKASLYLACGIPVITWKEAAIATFITEHGCGVAVNSLRELPQILSEMGETGYQCLKQNAEALSGSLRRGSMTLAALQKLQNQRAGETT